GSTVFFQQGEGTCASRLYRAPTDGRASPTRLTAAAADYWPAISADGRMLAWVHSSCPGEASLQVMDLRSRLRRAFRMDNPPAVDHRAAWAPDDRHLAFLYRAGAGVTSAVTVL